MKIAIKWIPCLIALILSVSLTLSGSCKGVIANDTLSVKDKAVLLSMLPSINKDLQLCDLIKVRVGLLEQKIEVQNAVIVESAKQLGTCRAEQKKDRRRFRLKSIGRTVAEVVVLSLTVIALSR